MSVIIADYDMRTALGADCGSSMAGMLAGTSAIKVNNRMEGRRPDSKWPTAVCSGITYSTESLVMQMLAPQIAALRGRIPPGALLLLATTVGEIDNVEASVLSNGTGSGRGQPAGLLKKLAEGIGLTRSGCLVSCACASSSMAMALGASLIRTGVEDDVLVVGCDAVSEFALAGFESLAALSPDAARPFDRDRQGLSLGEACGWCWLRGAESQRRTPAKIAGRLAGWSCRADAYHMTAPDPQGRGLILAIQNALRMAGMQPEEIGAICAHGTGTRYNDEMEMKAFSAISLRCPMFSIKGHVGHTLGAAGLIEAIVAIEASRDGSVPPTAGCRIPDCATPPVSLRQGRITPSTMVLSTNSGFGGINTALLLRDGTREDSSRCGAGTFPGRQTVVMGIGQAAEDGIDFLSAGGSTHHAMPGAADPGALFPDGFKNWGRLSPSARQFVSLVRVALQSLKINCDDAGAPVLGVIGVSAQGCFKDNVRFFRDYVENGRSLARGALFVYTLPTTPVAEASIHFKLHGPVLSLVDPLREFSRAVEWAGALINCGDADAMIVASVEEERIFSAFVRTDTGLDGKTGLGRVADLVSSGRLTDWTTFLQSRLSKPKGQS